MKRVKWLCRNIPEVISCSAFAVVLLVVFFNVLLRYLFSISFRWCEEVAAIGFVWVIFIGAAVCYKRKMHIGIDVLVLILPRKVSFALQVSVNIFMVLLNIWLVYLSLTFSINAWVKLSLALRIPYTFVDIAAVIGFSFMSWYAYKDFLYRIKHRKENGNSLTTVEENV